VHLPDAVDEKARRDLLEHGDADGARHLQVHDEHVGSVLDDRVQCLDTVGAVSDHADVGLALQQTLEAREHDGMVVGDDDGDPA
jgi:hypothetical protein